MTSALGTASPLAHVADTLPLLVQGLLPQGDLVVSATHSKDVARDRPAHVPDNILKGVQDLWSPSASILLSPYNHPSILTARGERLPAWAQARSPSSVPHPITVSLQLGLLDPSSIQILTRLSQPPLTNLFIPAPSPGAQLTELQPIV